MSSLRDRRRALNLSAAVVAENIGVHRMSLTRWERREQFPGPRHIHGLAQALGLEVSQVADFFDEARPALPPATDVAGVGLRTARRAAGVTVNAIARRLEVPAGTVYNWEAGRCRIPGTYISPLGELLGIPQERLVSVLNRRPLPTEQDPRKPPLQRLRERAGFSQETLAARTGLPRHSLGRWERRQQDPPLHAVRVLARTYRLPVSTLAAAAGVSAPRELDHRHWVAGDLPQALRLLRRWSGISRAQLADRIEVSPDAVRAWESGRCLPREESRRNLEAIFNLPSGSFLRTYGTRRL